MADTRQPRRRVIQSIGALTVAGLAGCLGGDGDDGDDGGNGGDDGGNGTQETVTINTATSVEGSTAFRIASTAGELIRQEGYTDVFNLEATVSPGATGGYRMLANDDVDMANPSTYSLDVSPDGGPFEEDPLPNFDQIRQVRGLYNVQPFLIAPADAGIETFEDLEGQTVSFGSAGAATRVPSETMVDLGVGLDNVNREYVGYSDQPSALRGGRVDAIFGYTNNDAIIPGWMQELDATTDWTHVQYTDDMREQFVEQLPFTATRELDGSEFFESYSDTLTVYNLDYVQCVKADMDNDLINEYARVTFERGEDLFEQDNALGFFPEPDFFLGGAHPDIPFHQGAFDYYTEAGIWEDYDLTAPSEAE